MEVKSVCCTCVPPSMDHRPACMSTGTLQDCEGWGEPEWQAVLSPGLCVCGSEFAQRWSWGAVSNGEVLVLRRAPGSRHGCLSSHHINQLGHHPGEEDWPQKHVRQEALLLQACAHLLGRTLGNMWEH